MGLLVDAEHFVRGSETLRAAGVSAVEYADDGSMRRVEYFPGEPATIPAPPPSVVARAHAATEPAGIDGSSWRCPVGDPHPDLFDPDEAPSEKIRRETEALLRRVG